uniref:type I protein arginine methyltransferase n=1 Tax=Rhodosorus marinus TaxID=101924 RepID=A0A7S2ZMP2_9RHOD|mmetsp:Transcript_25091/g.98973  ORF Transcript_25091/g.98973 Transcript_25091/m.98973 type:complete len:218 (+) Transcript_25091:75-728(+)
MESEEKDESDQKGIEPSGCKDRGRVDDAYEAASGMRDEMSAYSPEVVAELVNARKVAEGADDWQREELEERRNTLDEDDQDQLEDDEDVSNEEDQPCLGLFDDVTDPSPAACLRRSKIEYNVDILQIAAERNLDFYQRIRLVNYIRKRRIHDRVDAQDLAQEVNSITEKDPVLNDESLLTPIVDDDALLTVLEVDEDWEDEEDEQVVADAVRRAVLQ